ncbi:MAG: AAA domain-containing protein [Caldilineaceae bacterium]
MTTQAWRHPHFQQLAYLLALESAAEQEQLQARIQQSSAANAERSGNTLVQLTIRDSEGGLGGRVLVTLGKRNEQLALPWTRLRTGSPVQLARENGEKSWRGVISQLRRETVQVALTTWPESEDPRTTYRLDLAGDEIARRREEAALVAADSARGNRLAELRRLLLGEAEPYFSPPQLLTPFDPSLNEPQRAAVVHALSAADVAIIHGPPGTGKTTAVVELIRQAVQRGERVLACAPSNLAVDNMLERLVMAPELRDGAVLRIGHPARVLPQLRDHTLELLIEEHADMKLVRRFIKAAYALRAEADRFTRAKPLPGERQEKRAEAKALLADAQRLETELVERLLSGAQVLCSTLTGIDERFLGERTFDLCVIDEAAQSTEPSCWIPLRYCNRVVLAGDHQQLPPTIVSKQAMTGGLGVSLLERLITAAPALACQLTVQYRMHTQIMDFSSRAFYAESLMAHPTVADQLLCDLRQVTSTPLTTTPIHFIDTAGADYNETVEEEGESRFNEQEALLVGRKVTELLDAGLLPTQICVISPYAAQVRLLREQLTLLLDQGLEIGSIDGMQGREQEAVILSLVRSNPEGEIGFLADTRRMNVALTRARRKLVIIGDSATIGGEPFYATA